LRLAIVAPVQEPVPACWAGVPAAVNERAGADDLLAGSGGALLLAAQGFAGRQATDQRAQDGLCLLTPPRRRTRRTRPRGLRRCIAQHRNRMAVPFAQLKDRVQRTRHRAHTVWGLLTRIVGQLAALTITTVWQHAGLTVP
jgi:hypothetical protein